MECRKYHPVCQPLDVIILHLGLQGSDGAVGRVGKPTKKRHIFTDATLFVLLLPDKVGKKLSPESKSKPGHHESDDAVSNVQPLDPSVVLQSLEGVSDLMITLLRLVI